jgi:hypothetical protein
VLFVRLRYVLLFISLFVPQLESDERPSAAEENAQAGEVDGSSDESDEVLYPNSSGESSEEEDSRNARKRTGFWNFLRRPPTNSENKKKPLSSNFFFSSPSSSSSSSSSDSSLEPPSPYQATSGGKKSPESEASASSSVEPPNPRPLSLPGPLPIKVDTPDTLRDGDAKIPVRRSSLNDLSPQRRSSIGDTIFTQNELRFLKLLYTILDKDDSQSIEREELAAYAEESDDFAQQRELDVVMEALDSDGDGVSSTRIDVQKKL